MLWSDPTERGTTTENGSQRLMKGSLGTESHGEEDSGGPSGWARVRLALASLLLGSPILFQVSSGPWGDGNLG